MSWLRRWPLAGFYLLAYACTWSLSVPLMLSRRGWVAVHLPEGLELLAAFGPFVAAMLVARALAGRAGPAALLASCLRWRVGVGWWGVALGSPVALLAAAALALWAAGQPLMSPAAPGLATLATAAGLADLVVAGGIIQGWGEEPGWRGFALPRLLARNGPLGATLRLFPVWLGWHLPSFLARPEFGWAQLAAFSVGILAAAVWLTLIWRGTASVLAAAGWHAMVNICRGVALAASTGLFLAFSNAVLLGALLIAIGWARSGRRRAVA